MPKDSSKIVQRIIIATMGLMNAKLFATNSEVFWRSHTNTEIPSQEFT